MTTPATISSTSTLALLRAELKEELVERILPYWMRAVDEKNGGFVGLVYEDGVASSDASKGSILNARILWTFSAAYAALGGDALLATARRAADYFSAHFIDATHGGVFWSVDVVGAPDDHRKHVYAQAFAMYALAEYYRATGDDASLENAKAIFELVEVNAYDQVFGGYEEAFSREWFVLDDSRLGADDVDAPKSMNTHLHLLEAYTALLRVWPNQLLRKRLTELVGIFTNTIVGKGAEHAQLFFENDWTPVERIVSYGHDIETSWLVLAAADALGDPVLRKRAKELSLRLAASSLHVAFDQEYGGLFNGTDARGALDTDKEWWAQAEAIVGFVNAFIESGDEEYLDAAQETWGFVRRYVSDAEGGEWHRRVSRSGEVRLGHEKVGPWKCPYHNARACLEIMARVANLSSRA
ncbi:MAG: N-acyl-D-glucosamine 2-epimerase [Gemmatimonadetes bacterium]|nr:N-acyl-D-glucosamine 2-epimerase [Gemmatimonadota bacterium]